MKKVLYSLLAVFVTVSVCWSGSLRLPSSRLSGAHKPDAATNLCYNGSFDAPGNPLDGWMIDYQWTGNSFYKNNHNRISALASYGGHKDVMYIDGRAGETKTESRPIPYEQGARYRCTIDMKTTGGPHMYFLGYKWKPGIRPYRDKPVHIGDLRPIYKSQFRGHKVTNMPGGWKRVTFEFPMENASKMAQKSLKYLRFFTVYFIVINDAKGEAWIDNVTVKKIE